MLSGLIRAAKADGSAAWTLLGISFLYGIFHAAGPGHGKAVISSYLVANDETWRRGIILSFASAHPAGADRHRHRRHRRRAARRHRQVDGQHGARHRDRQLRAHRHDRPAPAVGEGPRISARCCGARRGMPMRIIITIMRHDHDHAHDHHGTTIMACHDHAHHDHDHEDEASAWGHAHAPEPSELDGKHWLRRGLSAMIAVGLRPCSGAIIVLVFALAQGLFWIGVASTFVMGLGTAITVASVATLAVGARGFAGRLAKAKPGARHADRARAGDRRRRGHLVFGVALLTGYMVSERMMGV